MKILWFAYDDSKELDSLSKEAHRLNLDAVLLPWVIGIGDPFIRIARAMDTSHNFKYMVAVRPYLVSPQYLAMTCKTLDQIDPNRIILNFVAGDIKEYELNFGGILGSTNDNTNLLDRKKYMAKFLKEFKTIYKNRSKINIPEICVSGTSEEIIKISNQYANYNLCDKMPFDEGFYGIDVKQIVCINPTIVDEIEEYKIKKENSGPEMMVVTSLELLDIIKKYKNKNVYGIMFRAHQNVEEKNKIFNFIEKYGKQISEL